MLDIDNKIRIDIMENVKGGSFISISIIVFIPDTSDVSGCLLFISKKDYLFDSRDSLYHYLLHFRSIHINCLTINCLLKDFQTPY